MTNQVNFWKLRFKAAGIHLCISILLALLAAALVFFIWYPYPYREISGGRLLFLLIVSVDVVMGPLLTFTVFNANKLRKALVRDLSVIGLFQLVALMYGIWTVAVARPVHLVFEIDRFRVVHAIDVPSELLEKAPAELRRLPLMGPTLLSVRDFKDQKESFEATLAALQGAPLGVRPEFWQDYAKARLQIIARARPISELKARFPARAAEIDRALGFLPSTGVSPSVAYVPMVSRDTFWTVLIDTNTLAVIAFVPIDSF